MQFGFRGQNKSNDKRCKYALHKSSATRGFFRTYIRSTLKGMINNASRYELEDFMYPDIDMNTYTWYDCRPHKPKIYK